MNPLDSIFSPVADVIFSPADGVMVMEGIIVPTGRERLNAQMIVDNIRDALSTLYNGRDTRLKGYTKHEAAVLKQAEAAQEGDLDSLKYLHDRLMGRPVQSTLSLGVTTDLKTFLAGLEDPEEPIKIEHGEGVFDV